MNGQQRAYIPALRFERLTRLFDLVVRFTMREATFKRRLVAQAGIAPGQRVLDIGCGTGTLALLVKRLHPETEVIGFDADATVLAIARRKAVAENLAVTFDQGLSDALPYPNQSIDRVLTSLFFHHLRRDSKVQTLSEIWRVLRPGGELHIADFGRPGNLVMRLANLPVRLLDGFSPTADNVAGKLPALIAEAGFVDVEQPGRLTTVFGTLALYRARKPST